MAGPHSAEAIRDRWIAMGLSTKSVDKALCEKKIKTAYSYAGLEAPKTFMWFPSPISAIIAIAALKTDERNKYLVSDGIRHQIHNEVFQNTLSAFDDRFSTNVGVGRGGDVLRGVREQVVERCRTLMMRQFAGQVHPRTSTSKNGFMRAVGEDLYFYVTEPARQKIQRFNALEDAAFEQIEGIINTLRQCRWGWSEEYWLAAYEASMRESKTSPSLNVLNRFMSLVQVREQISVFFPFAELVICCENPVVLKRDERNRLHSAEGPALAYGDGWKMWAWHGALVPQHAIEHPERLTIQQVDMQDNAEVRRVMIERMGWERFIREARLQPVHSDDWGTLYRKDLLGDPEPLMLVKVTNSTAEPDGSYKDYVLRVHHELRPLLESNMLGDPQKLTALNAIASTFGLKGDDYKKVLVQT